jgi:hypothetical protein
MPATMRRQPDGAVLDGVLKRVTFANPETGVHDRRIAAERGGAELVTAVGRLPGARVVEFPRLRGRWTSHPRYGRQLRCAPTPPCCRPPPRASSGTWARA